MIVRLQRSRTSAGRMTAAALRIRRERLPLTVEAVDCDGNLTPPDANGPQFEREARLPSPDIPGRCSPTDCPPNSGACNDAVAAVMSAQNALAPRCGICERIGSAADTKLAEAIAWTVATFIAFIVAIVAGQSGGFWAPILAAFFGILAVIFAAAANAAYQEEGRLRAQEFACRRDREILQTRFTEAVSAVAEHCCPGCAGVPLAPPC